jgi:Ala-tRNA(Pro) deacylase
MVLAQEPFNHHLFREAAIIVECSVDVFTEILGQVEQGRFLFVPPLGQPPCAGISTTFIILCPVSQFLGPNLGNLGSGGRASRCYICFGAIAEKRADSVSDGEAGMRISDYLTEQQIAFERLPHPPAYSAQKRAKYLRLPGRQVAKSVLLAGPSGYLLAVLPATHHVDTQVLAEHLGGPVRLADDREIAAVFRDCEWGVVSPFGTRYGLTTLLDASIPADAPLVLETHTQFESIRLLCRDFERLEQPRRLPFARRSPDRNR